MKNMSEQQQKPQGQGLTINANLDITPILYTDSIFMTINQYGLVLDVCQRFGPTNQLRVVSRIGMSRDHAKKFTQELGKLIVTTEGQTQTSEKGKN